MPHRARIGHHDFNLRLLVQRVRQVQTVQARRLHRHAHALRAARQKTTDSRVSFRRVRERAQVLGSPVPKQRYDQFLGTDFDPTRIKLVHDGLRGVGCGSGSPTLYRLRLTLRTQAPKASDSPRPRRRGRGLI